jgi:hypothetical protein
MKCIRQISWGATKDFTLAPLLNAPMHRPVFRITLRQRVTLRAGVQNPQNRFGHVSCWRRLATRPAFFRSVLFGKALPNRLLCSSLKRSTIENPVNA